MTRGFYGMFTPRLDDKGRVTVPARYRTAFADGAMVVRGDTRCLYVFTTDGFDDFAEDAIDAPVADADRIGPARYMLANSDFQMPDAQGRITLASRMRDYAELGRDVVLTGQGRRMEIWNTDRWAEYEAAQEAAYIDPTGQHLDSPVGPASPAGPATAVSPTTAPDDSAPHNAASDDPASDDPASDDPASDDPASDDPASDDPASDNTASHEGPEQ